MFGHSCGGGYTYWITDLGREALKSFRQQIEVCIVEDTPTVPAPKMVRKTGRKK